MNARGGIANWTIVIALAFVLGSLAPATAQGIDATPQAEESQISRSFVFYPADTGLLTAFEPTIEAGSSASLTVLFGNNGNIVQELRTYPINIFTASGGGIGVDDYGAEPNPVTSWIDYPEESYTFEVGEGIERTFGVNVPENTPPGEYVTAIAAEHVDAADVEGSDNFSQRLRYVVPIIVTVPGDMDIGFEFGEVTLSVREGILIMEVPVINTGDMQVRPEGNVEIRTGDGEIVSTIPVSMQPVFAREQTMLVVGIPGNLESGTFQISLDFADKESGVTAHQETANLVAKLEATPIPATIRVNNATITPGPDDANVQFATLDAIVTNSGDLVTNAQLSLVASLNGEEVERYPISQSLSLPTGDTPVNTRYIPATGWTTGTWTFELLLETVEPNGAAVVVARQQIEGSITIP